MARLEDGRTLDADRRNITRWIGESNRPRDDQAERLVSAFRKLGVILPTDYFKTKPRLSPTEELRVKAAERIRLLEKRIEELERRTSG